MNDPGLAPPPLAAEWDYTAIAAAAAEAGCTDLADLGIHLPPAPTIASMSLLVSRLPIRFADTVRTMSVVPS